MKSNNGLLGFVGGLAAGTILGLLFAPDKGSETRKKIATKGSDLKSKLTNLNSKVVETTKDLAEDTEDLLKEGKSTISQINKNITESI